MSGPCGLLLWQVLLQLYYHCATASLCLGGSDILASIRENSPTGAFVSKLSITGAPGASAVRLCLTGDNAEWLYLEGQTIRLNTSASRVLDREVLGSVLIAELTCSEDDVVQSHYRILVEIVNENDNKPKFLEETMRLFTVSELTAVNSVVFAVKALDADGDMISYVIDQSSRDAWLFRIDLPHTGRVVLNRPLDYETRRQLQVVIWAQEANTAEKFNTSAVVTVSVEDGDDQYPHFLPCTPVPAGVPVCMSPAYTANVTHRQQDAALEFSPGPIRAEDGDRGINTPLLFSILSGGDHGRFVINNRTGEIRLTRPVHKQQVMTNFTLVVMVCQENDRLKYSVASVLIRVLSENTFPPVFNRTTFKGFIIESSSPASIVCTYGNQVLQVQVSDRDFSDGLNPNIHYFLHPPSGLYHVTQQGVLIARTDRLHAFDRHILQVVARDGESGEAVSASVDIEVLQRGQPVPRGAFTEQPLFGNVDSRLAGGIAAMVLLLFLSAILFLLLRIIKRQQRRGRATGEHAAVAIDRHPNLVSSSPPGFSLGSSNTNKTFRPDEPSGPESFQGRQGVYTRRQSLLPPPSSSSSNIFSSDPDGKSRLLSDLVPIGETSDGRPEVTETIETRRLCGAGEDRQATGVSTGVATGVATGVSTGVSTDVATGVSTGVYGDDITALNSGTHQRW